MCIRDSDELRISPFNANDKRQTSFAGVEVMPKIEEEVKLDIPDKDLEITTSRSGGAGVDRDHSALLVVGAAQQALELPAVEVSPQLLQGAVGLGQQVGIGLEVVELNGGFGIGHGPLPAAQLLELALDFVELAHLGLGGLLVIPEIALGGQLLQVLLACG